MLSEGADLEVGARLEVKFGLFTEAKQMQVVVEGLLRDTNLLGSVVKSVPDQGIAIVLHHTVVKAAPQSNGFDHILDGALSDSLGLGCGLLGLLRAASFLFGFCAELVQVLIEAKDLVGLLNDLDFGLF